MTPAEGYNRARYQTPGEKVVMGPTAASIERIKPLPAYDLRKLPGDASWLDRELRLALGFVPSEWAKTFAFLAIMRGHHVTKEEWVWLHGEATLIKAREWLAGMKTSRSEEAA